MTRVLPVMENRQSAWTAVCAAVLIGNLGLALTTHDLVVPLACSGATVLGYVRSWRIRNGVRSRTQTWMVAGALHLALIYLLLDLFNATFGGDLPQAHFALMVAAIISFDLRTRRNLYSHLLMSLVVLYIGGLYAWDVLYLLPVITWGIATAAFLSTAAATSFPLLHGRRPSWRRHRWLAVWLTLSAVLFILIPEPPGRPFVTPFVIGNPVFSKARGEALPALLPLVGSDSGSGPINLRARGRLGDEVALRVRANQPSYWRAYALDGYTGDSWQQVSPAVGVASAMGQNIHTDPVDSGAPDLSQTFILERPLGNTVLAAYPLDQLYLTTGSVLVRANGTVEASGTLGAGTNYSAVSGTRDLSPARLRLAAPFPLSHGPDSGTDAARQQMQGRASTSRVQGLATATASGSATEYGVVVAMIQAIQSMTTYSLAAPRLRPGADAADQFLFVDHVGFCEQYATSLAVMLRAVGIPARLAIGYTTGDLDRFTGTYTVHNSEAHSWVEVFFPQVGWVPFDPTPGFDQSAGTASGGLFLGASGLSSFSGSPAAVGVAGAVLLLALLVVALVAATRRLRRLRRLQPAVRPYASSQLWLRCLGLPRRRSSETPAEHLARLAAVCPEAGRSIGPLVRILDAGLYASAPASRPPLWRLGLVMAGLTSVRSCAVPPTGGATRRCAPPATR